MFLSGKLCYGVQFCRPLLVETPQYALLLLSLNSLKLLSHVPIMYPLSTYEIHHEPTLLSTLFTLLTLVQ